MDLALSYSPSMQREHYQIVLASVWILAIAVAAIAIGVTSVSAFAAIAVIALGPPLVMQRLWREPAETMSESIRDARR
jgi:hypothetical protein